MGTKLAEWGSLIYYVILWNSETQNKVIKDWVFCFDLDNLVKYTKKVYKNKLYKNNRIHWHVQHKQNHEKLTHGNNPLPPSKHRTILDETTMEH